METEDKNYFRSSMDTAIGSRLVKKIRSKTKNHPRPLSPKAQKHKKKQANPSRRCSSLFTRIRSSVSLINIIGKVKLGRAVVCTYSVMKNQKNQNKSNPRKHCTYHSTIYGIHETLSSRYVCITYGWTRYMTVPFTET